MINWRENISGINDLKDLDIVDLMIHIRHQFLSSANDLLKCKSPIDVKFGEQELLAAINVQEAIDNFTTGW